MDPKDILDNSLKEALKNKTYQIKYVDILERLRYVCQCLNNRAGIRLVMACMLAKIHQPRVDPRKPYTEIKDDDSFSGRIYDERYITNFINENRLPCNTTTAFLTPALRNIDRTLTTDVVIIGRPRDLYLNAILLLDDVYQSRVNAQEVINDAMRFLIGIRNENDKRVRSLLRSLKSLEDALPLSVEDIVTLLRQHLSCKGSSRLPTLIVAAAYKAAFEQLGERAMPLKAHNAADIQTGALGDVEICLADEERVVTAYEMKCKKVAIDDIDRAVQKIAESGIRVDNYIFITTDAINEKSREYARSLYEETMGVEIAILDCIGFIRHFLHLFSRLRITFLDAYQNMVLNEPESAVNQSLKEAFLVLRKTAQASEN